MFCFIPKSYPGTHSGSCLDNNSLNKVLFSYFGSFGRSKKPCCWHDSFLRFRQVYRRTEGAEASALSLGRSIHRHWSTSSKINSNNTIQEMCEGKDDSISMEHTDKERKECQVMVVGAGFAGLSAALRLYRSKAFANPEEEILIIEASNRIGGRAYTKAVSNEMALEMGATWLHGLRAPNKNDDLNPVLHEALQAGALSGLPSIQQWWENIYALPRRMEPLTKDEEIQIHNALQVYEDALETIDGDSYGSVGDILDEAKHFAASSVARNSSRDHSPDSNPAPTVQGQDKKAPEDLLFQEKGSERASDLFSRAWSWREKLQGSMDGCASTSDMHAAAKAAYAEWGNDSERHAPIPNGFSSICNSISEKGIKILKNHEVLTLYWNKNGMVEAHCANGTVIVAPVAIITVSLGVLQNRHDHFAVDNDKSNLKLMKLSSKKSNFGFCPPLPKKISNAISRLRIGIVDKIFILFHCNSSDKQQYRSAAIESKLQYLENMYSGTRSYALLWDADPQISPQRLPDWAQGIYSLRFGGPEVKCMDKHGIDDVVVAVAWITGDAAMDMERVQSDEEILHVMRDIVSHFPAVQLPYGADWNNATLIRSRWGSDPFIRGSYSFVGAEGSLSDVETLANGVEIETKDVDGNSSKRLILAFAGEACHLEHIGTVHGAWQSGKKAADRIVQQKHSKNR